MYRSRYSACVQACKKSVLKLKELERKRNFLQQQFEAKRRTAHAILLFVLFYTKVNWNSLPIIARKIKNMVIGLSLKTHLQHFRIKLAPCHYKSRHIVFIKKFIERQHSKMLTQGKRMFISLPYLQENFFFVYFLHTQMQKRMELKKTKQPVIDSTFQLAVRKHIYVRIKPLKNAIKVYPYNIHVQG